MEGWRRSTWYDETGLKWIRPSPNLPTLTSALILSRTGGIRSDECFGRAQATSDAFQHVGRTWLRAREIVDMLQDRGIPGVKFEAEHFTPRSPSDGKYGGQSIRV